MRDPQELQNARRARRLAQGLCARCGKRPLVTTYRCQVCREKINREIFARKWIGAAT